MKLEFLASGAADCPLVRLFSFTSDEVGHLHPFLVGLSREAVLSVSLHEDMTVERIGGCQLRLLRSKMDRGMVQTGEASFDCVLTPAGWDNMAELVKPFCEKDTNAFQWLCERTKIKLLLSKDGSW